MTRQAVTDALLTEGAAKIAELIRERDNAKQEAADLRRALTDSQNEVAALEARLVDDDIDEAAEAQAHGWNGQGV